jgi:hypothetical protein
MRPLNKEVEARREKDSGLFCMIDRGIIGFAAKEPFVRLKTSDLRLCQKPDPKS